jgi:hypothetical protein
MTNPHLFSEMTVDDVARIIYLILLARASCAESVGGFWDNPFLLCPVWWVGG